MSGILAVGPEALPAAAALARLSGTELLITRLPAEPYTADGYTEALAQIIRHADPEAVVFPHNYQVRDYAPKLATRFGRVLVSDVIDFRIDGGQLVCVRQLFQGKLNCDVRITTPSPAFISVQAGAWRAGEETGREVEFIPRIDPSLIRARCEEPFREAESTVDLTAADAIVAVGRGIREKENIALAGELAAALGAELAASRPVCDNGWLPMERQVGSSGQTVAPKLYIALGISGAIQHLVGMKGSKTIVAVNKDANAPIFEVADYGLVADLMDVLPALTAEVKKAKS